MVLIIFMGFLCDKGRETAAMFTDKYVAELVLGVQSRFTLMAFVVCLLIGGRILAGLSSITYTYKNKRFCKPCLRFFGELHKENFGSSA